MMVVGYLISDMILMDGVGWDGHGQGGAMMLRENWESRWNILTGYKGMIKYTRQIDVMYDLLLKIVVVWREQESETSCQCAWRTAKYGRNGRRRLFLPSWENGKFESGCTSKHPISFPLQVANSWFPRNQRPAR